MSADDGGAAGGHDIADNKECFMRMALLEAQKAAALQETPIGAVIVKDGEVIASSHNLRESRQDVTLHAEITAIREACRILGSWRLDGCDLYVTLEPCIMCAGAIQQARIRKVFFGALEPKSGGIQSKARILDLDLNHHVDCEGGVLAEESLKQMKAFFSAMRSADKSAGLTKGQRRAVNKGRTISKSQSVHKSQAVNKDQSVSPDSESFPS